MELRRELGLKFPQLLESPFLKINTTLALSCSSGIVSVVHHSFMSSLRISFLTSVSFLKCSIGISSGPGAFLRWIFLLIFLNSAMVIGFTL